MIPALLVALLTLPFHPFWMDMELARRGWLLCLAGALALLRPRSLFGPLGAADAWFLLFLLWSAVGAMGAANGWDAFYRLAHLTALFAVFRWGRGQEPAVWLRAILPTTVAVAAYGLLQGAGLEWPAHYATASAPVSTLGNLNVASEMTALGVAAALVLLWQGERILPIAAVILGSAYLVVNGSRSGLVAAPAALLWLAVTVRGRTDHKVLAFSMGLLGAGLGVILPRAGPSEQAPPPTAPEYSTIEVRQEIWKGCLRMTAETPLLGQGPGQFSTQYPRFRSQKEIELSSHDRQFPSSPRTAHNDPLEILVEAGVPGLLLSLGFLATACLSVHRSGMPLYLAPLVSFLLLGLVRSPLGNAPVVAWVMVFLGTLLPITRTDPGKRIWGAVLLGLLLLMAGLPILASQTLAAPYLAARADLRAPDPEDLASALTWGSPDTRLLELSVQESLNRYPPAISDAERDLAALQALAPHSPVRLSLLAQEALLVGDLDLAQEALDALAVLDPGDLKAATLQSSVHFRRGHHQAAVDAVYRLPHPRLRAQLEEHMRQLEAAARNLGDLEAARFYECEGTFLRALKQLREMGEAQTAVQDAVTCFGETGRIETDVRPWVLSAIQFHALDDEANVADMAAQVRSRGLSLDGVYRDLFGNLVEPLLEIEAWRGLIR